MPEYKPRQKQFKSTLGNDYVFQSIPNSNYLELIDEGTHESGKPLLSKMYPRVLKDIVVQPANLTVDSFEEFSELQEVCEAALTFQQSK